MNIGTALISYNSRLARLLTCAPAGILASEVDVDWSLAPAVQYDQQHEIFSPHRYTITPRYAVSTYTEASGLSCQAAALTNSVVVPNAGALQFESRPSVAFNIEVSSIERWGFVLPPAISAREEWLSLANTVWNSAPSVFVQIDDDREQRAASEADRALVMLPGEIGAKVRHRLHDLIAIARDEGLETAGPAPDSVRAAVSFLAAISAHAGVRLPSITLDSDGIVVYEWRDSGSGSVILRFLSDGTVGCALMTSAPGTLGRQNVWFGSASAEEARRTVLNSPALPRVMR